MDLLYSAPVSFKSYKTLETIWENSQNNVIITFIPELLFQKHPRKAPSTPTKMSDKKPPGTVVKSRSSGSVFRFWKGQSYWPLIVMTYCYII